jgi:hypothetical protein
MSFQNVGKIIAGGALGIGFVAMTYFSEYGFARTAQAAGERAG